MPNRKQHERKLQQRRAHQQRLDARHPEGPGADERRKAEQLRRRQARQAKRDA